MDAWEHPRPPAGTITIEHEGPTGACCAFAVRWIPRSATQFTTAQRRERVVVDAIDAESVTFVSSSALALLLTCVEASLAAGRHPVLRAASHQVDRALRLAGIDSVFPRPQPESEPTD
jgi:ABC-type transporter Mla MlaB component